jgi:post-segregation antitoxin (ccd killing protein)
MASKGDAASLARNALSARENAFDPSAHFVATIAKMASFEFVARLNRKGKTETFSVSVSSETRKQLKRAADRAYAGNVSALIEAIAREATRHEALEWLIDRAAPIDEKAYRAFLDEVESEGAPKKRRRRAT